jgi:glyoxylase-like metal-dependent hydrolase (beta-lactamase superfamily II)
MIAGRKIHRYKILNTDISCVICGEFKENCYVVRDPESHQQLLIDPGDNIDDIEYELENNNCPLVAIALTHGHFDHIGSAAYLSRKFDLPISVHQLEKKLLKQASTYALTLIGKSIEPLENIIFFSEKDILCSGPTIEIFHTPGHTPGSVSLGLEGVLFTGDTLLHRYLGPTIYPGSNYDDILDSVDRLLAKLPEETLIMPGHGRPWSIGDAKDWWAQNRSAPDQLNIFKQSVRQKLAE